MEVQLGENIGVDLKFKMVSEHKFTDLANLLRMMSHHYQLPLLSLPLPLMTVRSHSISLIYNPTTSATKEPSFVVSVGKIIYSIFFIFTLSGLRIWKEDINKSKASNGLPILPN